MFFLEVSRQVLRKGSPGRPAFDLECTQKVLISSPERDHVDDDGVEDLLKLGQVKYVSLWHRHIPKAILRPQKIDGAGIVHVLSSDPLQADFLG